MVWHEVGKYGIHNGRTLRCPWKPLKSSPSTKAGYITKVVVNRTNPLEKDDIKRHLSNFRIADGFDKEFVISESLYRGFDPDDEWSRGFQSYDMVLSLNKRKRWLLPEILREKLTEEEGFKGEGVLDPRVVLIERKSTNNQDNLSLLLRLKKGDCSDVLDSNDPSSFVESRKKRRKLCHVGDTYKGSEGTEITYEVCKSMPSKSWPNYKETRSNSARFDFWHGDFRKRGNKSSHIKEMMRYRLTDVEDLDADYVDDDDVLMADVQADDDCDHCRHEFDLEAYIANTVNVKQSRNTRQSRQKSRKLKAKSDQKSTVNLNPASSETVECYGKGCSKFIDSCQDKVDESNQDDTKFPSTPPAATVPVTKPRMESSTVVKRFELSILSDSLQSDSLQERFKSRYKEGESLPRKFSVSAPFCHHQCILFEPCSDGDTGHAVSCGVLVIFDNKQDDYSSEFGPCTIDNSCNKLAQLQNQETVLNVHEIVEIFESSCTCCNESEGSRRDDSKEKHSKIRKTVVAFDVLNSFTGHETKVSSLREASKEILSANTSQNLEESGPKAAFDQTSSNCGEYSKTCEICYAESNEFNEGFTALLGCNHWFCNGCWKAYLVAQLQLGKTVVSCPEMDCAEGIDDVTFMSLVPKSYFNYKSIQRDRAFELSQQWKWCPGDKCQLVTKVVSTKRCGTSGSMDEPEKKQAAPLPCICSCSQVWCFGCQEEPHWPVSCDQAQSFRQQTKRYQELVSSGEDRVTSVSIRRCPNCKYPLEKDGGCPHMVCTKCHGEFCWTCLHSWGVHNNCVDAKSEEVELTDTIGNARFNKHVKTSTYHKKARKVEHLFKMYKAVEEVANAVMSHQKLEQHMKLIPKLPSRTQAFFALCHKNNIPEKLKLMVDTKFISHSVIEGASMHMATSKTKRGHQAIQRLVNDLHFVIIRLEHYLAMKLEELSTVLDQAMALVASAKAIIVAIGKYVISK